MAAGSPTLGTPEYFLLVAEEYFQACGFYVNERPAEHAHFQRLLRTCKEVYRAGHQKGEDVADSMWRDDLLCPVHARLDQTNQLRPFDNCVACIRVHRDELRRAFREALLRFGTGFESLEEENGLRKQWDELIGVIE